MHDQAVVTVDGPLQEGLAAAMTHFVYRHKGEITDFTQYVDSESDPKSYFARMSWRLSGFMLAPEEIQTALNEALGSRFDVGIDLRLGVKPSRIAILVSQELPCLYTLLLKCFSQEWFATPVLLLSNHLTLKAEAERFDLPFIHLEVTPENRESQGDVMLDILGEYEVDLVVLAKYMQIIPPRVVAAYRNRMINIHHSLLPAFAGARPYRQARDYGVKYVGATAHYVVDELDEGPIIAQGMCAVTHSQTSNELALKGRSIEADVLAQAVKAHLEHRIIVSGRRTIILDG